MYKQGFILKLLKVYWSYKLYHNEIISSVILLRSDCFCRRFSLVYTETFSIRISVRLISLNMQ